MVDQVKSYLSFYNGGANASYPCTSWGGSSNFWTPQQNYLGGLVDTSYLLARSLKFQPCNIWAARNYTQAANVGIHFGSQPYGFYSNFTGNPHYVVADPLSYPPEVAWAAKGYSSIGFAAKNTMAAVMQTLNQAALNVTVSSTGGKMNAVLTFASTYKENEAVKKDDALKKELEQLEVKAKQALEQLQKATVDEKGQPKAASEVKAVMSIYEQTAKALDEQATALGKRVDAAIEKYQKEQAEAAAKKAQEGLDNAGAVEGGSSSVATVEGDTVINDNGQLASEYNVKAPVVASGLDVGPIVRDAKDHLKNNDDDKDRDALLALFDTTKGIKADNIVEVLDGIMADDFDFYDGVYEVDDNKNVMLKFTDALRARVKSLEDNNYLSKDEADGFRKILDAINNKLGTGDDGMPSSQPNIKIDKYSHTYDASGKRAVGIIENKERDVNGWLREIVHCLKGLGTQNDFDRKIKEAQNKRIADATKTFVGDFATSQGAGKKAKSNATLPAGVTYLPNSKQFQWKSGDKVFKGDSLANLKQAVVDTADTELIAKFQAEVLEKMKDKIQ